VREASEAWRDGRDPSGHAPRRRAAHPGRAAALRGSVEGRCRTCRAGWFSGRAGDSGHCLWRVCLTAAAAVMVFLVPR